MRRSLPRATDTQAPRQLELRLVPPPSPPETPRPQRPRPPLKRAPVRPRPPRSPADIAKRVMELLASMGYRATEARWLVWTALRSGELPTHRPATQTELLRAALRAGAARRAVR
ncbi:MAG: hypothetical protein JJ863_14350 [Deltaproteobacteria bacterium]|nr:hypothetical protein [Deltaproteobacteria bacterium]